MTDALNQTPLHSLHVELGAKMVDFAGWSMPVQYSGIIEEHTQCREKAAFFDVSHMGQVELRGSYTAKALEKLVPSDIDGMSEGKARYTLLTNEDGGIMDDLIVSNAGDHLYLVVNAAMRDQDIGHLRAALSDVDVVELIDRALVAVQGPKAEAVVAAFVPEVRDLGFMETVMCDWAGISCRISRLGYTGEDGFEISLPDSSAREVVTALLDHPDVGPAGLGARDTLRLEAGLCLYGNDIDGTTSPVEANLPWTIQKRRREDGGFHGADRILAELASGPSRKLVGILPDGRAPARQGTEICTNGGQSIGAVTSGGFGPTTGGPISMGYVDSNYAGSGTSVILKVRNREVIGTIVELPFVPHKYKR